MADFNHGVYVPYNKSIIMLTGKISEEMGSQCLKELILIRETVRTRDTTLVGPNHLEILINNSRGGDLHIGFAIYDYLMLLKSMGVQITTTAINRCMSAATIIFMAGDIRRAGSHTDFLIHNVTATVEMYSAEKLFRHAKKITDYNDALAKIYSTVGKKKTVRECLDKMAIDEEISADTCLDYGIVTDIF